MKKQKQTLSDAEAARQALIWLSAHHVSDETLIAIGSTPSILLDTATLSSSREGLLIIGRESLERLSALYLSIRVCTHRFPHTDVGTWIGKHADELRGLSLAQLFDRLAELFSDFLENSEAA